MLLAKDTAVSVLDRADGWTRELGMPKRMRYRARAAWGGAQEGMHEGNAPAASGVPSARGDAREGSGETAKGMTEAEEEGRRRWEEGQVRVRAVLQRVGERARAKASAAVGAGIASAREAVSSVPLPGRDPGQSVQAIALRRRVELGRVHEVSQAGLTQALRAVRPFSADSGLWHFLTSDVSLREPVFREVAVLAWRRWPTPSSPPRLWVRSYRDIPVRSWRIVLPDRYLTFRPVDLLRADLISLAAVGGAIAGTRLDNEVLQLVSLVGAAGALVRVILTYYRIVAGGDCLVLRTLHGRTTAVGQAALSHVAVEAAQQQGAQAALAYAAAVHLKKRAVSAGGGGADAEQNAGGIASRQSAASGRESAGLSVGVKAKEGAPVRVDDVRRVVQGWLEEHGAVKEFRCGEAFAALERLGIVDMSDDKRMITVRTRLE